MMVFRRFIVFIYNNYYPQGGLGDVDTSFDSMNDAKCYCYGHIRDRNSDNYEILDRETGETISIKESE